MRVVIQRVNQASVEVDGQVVGEIKKGFLLLLGVTHEDTETTAERLARKIARLRIFSDHNDKTNLSLLDIEGSVLVVSQFTLYADTRKGNRPSFGQAAHPDSAESLIGFFIQRLKSEGIARVESGTFGAHMNVSLCNDGPFTIIMEAS